MHKHFAYTRCVYVQFADYTLVIHLQLAILKKNGGSPRLDPHEYCSNWAVCAQLANLQGLIHVHSIRSHISGSYMQCKHRNSIATTWYHSNCLKGTLCIAHTCFTNYVHDSVSHTVLNHLLKRLGNIQM